MRQSQPVLKIVNRSTLYNPLLPSEMPDLSLLFLFHRERLWSGEGVLSSCHFACYRTFDTSFWYRSQTFGAISRALIEISFSSNVSNSRFFINILPATMVVVTMPG